MEAVKSAMSGAASTFAGAASTVHAASPTSGTGTPLMNLASYLLYLECALILILSVPVYVPYRKQLMEFIHYSPSLWTFRVVIFCVNAFVAILLGDTYLRLNTVTRQIEAIQIAHTQAMTGSVGAAGVNQAANTFATGGAPAGAAFDASAQMTSLNDLHSSRFRGQRDFYILAFTLFCSTVLFQLHLLLIKMDKFRLQRDELRTKHGVRKANNAANDIANSASKTANQASVSAQRTANNAAATTQRAANNAAATAGNAVNSAAATAANAVNSVTAGAKGVANTISSKVDHMMHPEPVNIDSTRTQRVGIVAPAEPGIIHQRVVVGERQEL
ncbi:B-cell receptor-associated protein 31-like-domain-containing protein [Phlyctochytrium arcticum]|nr:B-cell receptor-associated protein 31-like-domain-containing protein [Phlyctochytrium arcticum]